MEAADVLYGVTMGSDGVSQIVSRRLPQRRGDGGHRMTDLRQNNDLSFVLRVADLLESARLRTWVFGGWAEELTGLTPPRRHGDIDLLYPGHDFDRVDRFLDRAAVDEWIGKRKPHKRAFEFEGVLVELILVQRDEQRLVHRLRRPAATTGRRRLRRRRPPSGRERDRPQRLPGRPRRPRAERAA